VSASPAGGRIRRWLLNVHLYGGLLCSSYLLLYGLTALDFSHDFGDARAARPTSTWEGAVTLGEAADDEDLAALVNRELGLFGWPLPWTVSRDPSGDLSYRTTRPGRSYEIRVSDSGRVAVEERREGLWHALRGLHGQHERIPGAPVLLSLWPPFTELTNWMLLFSMASGVYLWVSRNGASAAGWALLATAAAGSLGLMAWVLLLG